jgi:arginine decarboxylase
MATHLHPTAAPAPRGAVPHTPADAAPWSVDDARALYNIEGWGAGYFDIDARGHVVVRPDREHPTRELSLLDLARDLEEQGVALPVLLRFSDILHSRVAQLSERFKTAIQEYGYEGGYTTVFPIKVNQQRHVVEEIAEFGRRHGVGLECGSKPELQAVLALNERTDHLIVCNGYKDHEFMRLALMGQKVGHDVFIVVEQLSELDVLLEVADELGVQPILGVRIKLATESAGRWAQSAGEKSKFGLNPSQLVKLVAKLREAGRLESLKLLHFHLGSQIPDIRFIKAGLTEVARFYVELRNMGVDVSHVDVGGGLGVDYDGTASSQSNASVNYTLQEYANDVVFTMAEACRENEVPMPHLISESGRALTAHHALLLMKVIDVESQAEPVVPDITDDDHAVLHAMKDDLDILERGEYGAGRPLTPHKVMAIYHDASFAKGQARQLFNSGVLDLKGLAMAEQLYYATMNRVATQVNSDRDEYEEIRQELDATLVDRYFCNFSLFQSLPDNWAIDQLFPIMPVHRLTEQPARLGTLQDVTCDSDGKIDRFVGEKHGRPSLELHEFRDGEDYVLGIFLTGAYQEILGDLHNLFGDTNAVHVKLTDRGYEITDLVHGDTVTEVLNYVQFHAPALLSTWRRKVTAAKGLSRSEANQFVADYVAGLEGYTYLEGEAAR